MTRGPIALTLSLAIAAVVAVVPAAAAAGRAQGRPGGGGAFNGRPSGFHHGGVHHGGFHQSPGVFRPFAPHRGVGRHFGPRPFVRSVVTFGAFAAPIIYAPPLVYGSPDYGAVPYDPGYAYAPPVSYAPPSSYGPNVGGAIAMAPSPPPPSVVEFPTGRYELRGDGMSVPYTWVWIPNPPSSPPSAPPSEALSPSSQRQLYRWTDEAGVAHWTDRRDAVPQEYRAQAEQPRLR